MTAKRDNSKVSCLRRGALVHWGLVPRIGVPARLLLLSGGLIALPVGGCRPPSSPPAPPEGGRRYVLPYEAFVQNVEPVLRRQGCGVGGDCHGGGIRGTFQLSPDGAPDPRFDFTQAALQVNGTHPDDSTLLRKPLALDAGGAPHAFKVFASPEAADYQLLRQWIVSGVFE